jgi:hypothetical protein
MDERERMLAEGPRVAPEPPTADASVLAGSSAQPSPASQSPVGARQDGGRKMPRILMRFLPLALLGVLLVAGHGLGKYAFFIFIAVVWGSVLIKRVRRTGK